MARTDKPKPSKRALPKAAPKVVAKPAPKAQKAPKAAKVEAAGFDLEGRLAALPAAAADTAPHLPVKTALLEGERLWAAAKKIRTTFLALPGASATDFDAVPLVLSALAESERAWSRLRVASRDVKLVEVRKTAQALKQQIMASARYLLRTDAKAIEELDRIAEGDGLADLITDLDDLSTFMTTYRDVMRLDQRLPKNAAAQLTALGRTLRAGKDTTGGLDVQGRRNRVYALLEELLGEVRAGARYLYAKDPKRLIPYLSQYEAVRKRARRTPTPTDAPPTPATPATK